MKKSLFKVFVILVLPTLVFAAPRPSENLKSPNFGDISAGTPNFRNLPMTMEDRTDSFAQDIRDVLFSSAKQLMNKRIKNQYWKLPMYLGTMYTSQYLLLRRWLEFGSPFKLKKSLMDIEKYVELLKSTQKEDGSWSLIEDINNIEGDLNATIMHYAALKSLDKKELASRLELAKKFILSKGGIDKSSLFTKIILALFGNYSWNQLPSVPYIIFNENFIYNYKDFGQWIGPHLFPISYFRKLNVQKDLGPLYDLSELYLRVNGRERSLQNQTLQTMILTPDSSDEKLISKMLSLQKTKGSFGGYTSATLFTLVAFDHYYSQTLKNQSHFESVIRHGLNFVESLYFDSGESSYLGVTCDGRYWDTALIGQALVDAGLAKQYLVSSANYLLEIQNKNEGGFGFGIDFETYMDTDDTAEILMFLHHMGIDKKLTQKSVDWLFKMQNLEGDGGWGAFDKNNTGNFILKFATKDFLDSADMFDESSPDVTGHILEALALYGYNKDNSPNVAKAVEYLENEKTYNKKFSAWSGRWGSNYLYGTSASIIGLVAAGVKPAQSNLIKNSIQWIKSCQNKFDGGFGETFLSYISDDLACKGVSTPSQTAWALMALIAAGEGHSLEAKSAAQYLIKNYRANGQWTDGKTFVGTGHPKIVPMHYPAYAWSFPLIALSRYYKILKPEMRLNFN